MRVCQKNATGGLQEIFSRRACAARDSEAAENPADLGDGVLTGHAQIEPRPDRVSLGIARFLQHEGDPNAEPHDRDAGEHAGRDQEAALPHVVLGATGVAGARVVATRRREAGHDRAACADAAEAKGNQGGDAHAEPDDLVAKAARWRQLSGLGEHEPRQRQVR